MPEKVTMRTIAEACGVSVNTVSRCLRNDPRQKAETRERVQETAQRLGYSPNPMVAALMAQRRRNNPPEFAGIIAVINTHDQPLAERSLQVRRLHQGIQERAAQLGYRAEEFQCEPGSESISRTLSQLRARGVPGVLFLHFPQPTMKLALDLRDFAAAAIGHGLLEPALHSAGHFNFEGLQIAIQNLRRLGYSRIGLVTLKQAEERVRHQWIGSWQAAGHLGWVDPTLAPLVLDMNDPQNQQKLRDWIKAEQPDAVLSTFVTVWEWLRDTPDRPGLAFLDRPGPPLAGIDQNWEQIGAGAVDLITSQLYRNERGEPAWPRMLHIPCFWADGETAPAVERST